MDTSINLRKALPLEARRLAISAVKQTDRVVANQGEYIDRAYKLVFASVAIAFSAMMALVIIAMGSPTLSAIAYIGTALVWAVAAESIFDERHGYIAVPVILMAVVSVAGTFSALSSGIGRDFILGYLVWYLPFQIMPQALGLVLAFILIEWIVSIIAWAFVDEREKVLVKPYTPAQTETLHRVKVMRIRGAVFMMCVIPFVVLFYTSPAWYFIYPGLVLFGIGFQLVIRAEKLSDSLHEREGVPYKELPEVVARRLREKEEWEKFKALPLPKKLLFILIGCGAVLALMLWSVGTALLFLLGVVFNPILLLPIPLSIALPFFGIYPFKLIRKRRKGLA